MQLTRFTDYALRVLLFVGRQGGRIGTMGEVARYYDISQEHLRKVIHRLAVLGYLQSKRGRGGGIVLGRDAASIRLGGVILAMEEDLSIVDCHALDCLLAPECSLKRALDRGSRAFIGALDEFTLAGLPGSRRMQRQFRPIDLARADHPRAS